MEHREKKLLYGLICMAQQHLGGIGNDELSNGGRFGQDHALSVLVECGMAEYRERRAKGRWTEAGIRLGREGEGIFKASVPQQADRSPMSDRERKILNALIDIVEHQLGESGSDQLWSRGFSAYERALIVLAEVELVELTRGCLAGRWTDRGHQLRQQCNKPR